MRTKNEFSVFLYIGAGPGILQHTWEGYEGICLEDMVKFNTT